ncbi:hypothetical protein M3484_23055 [Pseudomonas sp. GX19020]|uniref:hypothetical protein n=1 Tax=Pseudomonas sp. GX19020 TaxID=2942277 RepID=UPI002019A079|nr:hypothetical protein [Pseudomonas sp. GX19020]MCL4069440.1 hypothetical protein [Pseudomonas sp. GX19020]
MDVAATLALAASIALLVVLFADLLKPPLGTTEPAPLSTLGKAAMFLMLLATPTISCFVLWPVHLNNRRRGKKVAGWLRYVVLASAGWMWLLFAGINTL